MESGHGTHDALLVRSIARGGKAALADAYDQYAAAVTRYAWALASSRMDVEEIVQDTFLTLWQRAGTVELHTGTLLPWLLVVCRNHALNLTRKHARRQTEPLPDEAAAPTGPIAARETLRWVRDEIAALPEVDRRLCELCLIDGRPYREAAALLELSTGAVTQRISRARARLKKAVTHDGH